MNTQVIKGTPVSPGLVLGTVHVVHAGADAPTWSVAREDVPLEIGRLASALTSASELLEERRRRVAASAGEKDAEIFAVHRLILQDPGAMREVETTITEQRINAEAAVQTLIARFEATMGDLEGDSVRDYASDVSDPWRLVLDALMQRDRAEVLQTQAKVILAAADLTPKVVTFLERGQILGIMTEKGGRFSHGAVLARSFGVPCVVGVSNLLGRLEQGMQAAIDGHAGVVSLRPSEEDVEAFLERKRSFEQRQEELIEASAQPAETPDGGALHVMVNIESIRDLDTFELEHVSGVGLLRTEFLYMERSSFPSEEEQYRMYRRVLERMNGRPVTLRILDIGGDKPLPYFQTGHETNPALGWRGIRITLQWRDLLRVQLRAMLRAASAGHLRILIPMVTSIEELEDIRSIFAECREHLVQQGYDVPDEVAVGVMIEVPSMLFVVDQVLEIVNFVSVGTNDLVQYLLAVDRDNSMVADLYDPSHPSVMRALQGVADSANRVGVSASVCGDLSGDPIMAVVLLGMGFDTVSVSSQFVPEIKYAIRRVTLDEAHAFAAELARESTIEGIQRVLDRVRARLYDADSEK